MAVSTSVRYSAHRGGQPQAHRLDRLDRRVRRDDRAEQVEVRDATANSRRRSCTMPWLLLLTGPPRPPCTSFRMRVKSSFSMALLCANRKIATASRPSTRKWTTRRRRSAGARSGPAAAGPAAAVPPRRGAAGTGRPAAAGSARPMSRSAGTGTSAGRRRPWRTGHPHPAAGRRRCRAVRGHAGRSRSARTAASAGSAGAAPFRGRSPAWRRAGPRGRMGSGGPPPAGAAPDRAAGRASPVVMAVSYPDGRLL